MNNRTKPMVRARLMAALTIPSLALQAADPIPLNLPRPGGNGQQSVIRQNTTMENDKVMKTKKLLRRRLLSLLKPLAWLLLCSMAACGPQRPAESSREITGTQAEGVAAVSKLMTRHSPLPSPLLGAHFLEEQTGDGRLGPSDFAAFYAITVAPADLPAWHAALAAIPVVNSSGSYAAPKKAQPWWVREADFKKLKLYGPKSLTGRFNGCVGLAPDGQIFIYAFTM
jgi:hypothetical protein